MINEIKMKKVMWSAMLRCGIVPEKWSYYGACHEKDEKGTSKLSKINMYDVDWEKTSMIYDDYEESFESTFSESSLKNYFFEGTLVMKNGMKYKVVAPLSDYIVKLAEESVKSQEQLKALDELTKQAQDLNMGY